MSAADGEIGSSAAGRKTPSKRPKRLQFLFTANLLSDKLPNVFHMTTVRPSGAWTRFACSVCLFADHDRIGGVFRVCSRVGMRLRFDACRSLARSGLLGYQVSLPEHTDSLLERVSSWF